jgi:hypothetical protein
MRCSGTANKPRLGEYDICVSVARMLGQHHAGIMDHDIIGGPILACPQINRNLGDMNGDGKGQAIAGVEDKAFFERTDAVIELAVRLN